MNKNDNMLTAVGNSVTRDQMAEQTDINMAHGLTELKRLQMLWSTVVLVTPFLYYIFYRY